MSDYEYQNWWQHLWEKHKGDPSAYVAESQESPDLVDFLKHQLGQIENAQEAQTADYRWGNLISQSGVALEALASGQVNRIAMAFCDLGQAIERLQHPSMEERVSILEQAKRGYELEIEKHNREKPLKLKALRQQFIKTQIQQSARELWENDSDKELRIGEVASYLMGEAEEAAKKFGMEKSSHGVIKGWLREIAPDYAQKRGAPKKQK